MSRDSLRSVIHNQQNIRNTLTSKELLGHKQDPQHPSSRSGVPETPLVHRSDHAMLV